MVRTNQGGSVLSFVIIGVVLVALFVGGAFGVRYLLKPQTSSTGGGTAVTPAPSPKDNRPRTDDSNKSQATPAVPAPQTSQNNPPSSNPTPATPAPSNTKAQLPTTGPADTLATIIAVASLSSVTAAYVQSRRNRATALTSLL